MTGMTFPKEFTGYNLRDRGCVLFIFIANLLLDGARSFARTLQIFHAGVACKTSELVQ